ncbi:hypothetical protein LPJ78_002650 [Coemansia sp. RSA 989]|nr:hypothetical protein LPJ78_002650 [Coemansia sp. RSA 989]
MGKSAKAVKRPTKKQKELKKSRATADAAIAKSASSRISGGGVSKPKKAAKARAAKSKKSALNTASIARLLLLLLMAVPFGLATSNVIDNINDWRFSGAMLSVARASIAAANVGHLALFAGGRLQNGTYTDVVDIYNRKTKKWTTSHLSKARSEIGAGSVGSRYALFAGGFDSMFRPMSLVDVYDAETEKWTSIHLKTPRASPRLISLGSSTAVVGGLSGDLQYLSNAVDFVDSKLSVFSTSLQSPYPQLGLALSDVSSETGLYTSGYQNNRPGERFNDFEPSNQTVVFGAPTNLVAGPIFPYPRWGAGGAATNGVFVVGGGHLFANGTGESLLTDRVDIFHASSQQWSSQPLKLSVPRDYPLVQVVGDYIVFLSGTDKSKDLDIFDTQACRFVSNDRHAPALYTLRSDAAATTIDGCLLMVAGGSVYQGRNTTASVEMFDACHV